MQHEFVDKHCATLPGAERVKPFGPDMVVWRVNGHMFAAYTGDGLGLSLRSGPVETQARRREAEVDPEKPAELPTGGGWTIVQWDTPPDALRARIDESYARVARNWPGPVRHA